MLSAVTQLTKRPWTVAAIITPTHPVFFWHREGFSCCSLHVLVSLPLGSHYRAPGAGPYKMGTACRGREGCQYPALGKWQKALEAGNVHPLADGL